MEVLAWMYMHDNRWLWGLGHPKRPSTIFIVICVISWSIALFTSVWESVYEKGTVRQRARNFDGH